MASPQQLTAFWTLVLRDGNFPVTQQNLALLNGWSDAEGTTAKNNPIATTEDVTNVGGTPGDQTIFNSIGVKNYATPELGAKATAATLNNGLYGAIVSALRSGNGASAAYGNSAIYQNLNAWAYGPNAVNKDTGAPIDGSFTDYVRNVLAYASGSSPGSSAADIGSVDFSGSGGESVGTAIVSAGQHVPGVVQAEGAVHAVGSGIHSVTDFLSALGNPALWIRIGEIVGGIMLVGLGLYVTVKDMGMDAPKLPGPLGNLQEQSADQVRQLELQNRQRAAETRSASIEQRATTQSSEYENRQKIARERYLQARAKTREKRANAKAAESGATAASRRAERAKSIQMEEIENLGIFK